MRRSSRLVAVAAATALGTGGILALSTPAGAVDDSSKTVLADKQAEKPDMMAGPMATGPHYGKPSETDLFAVDPDGNLTARWVNDSKEWSAPKQLADNADPDAKVATSKHYGVQDQTDVFYRGVDGKLYASYQYGNGGWKVAKISDDKVAERSGIAASQHFGMKNQTDVFYAGEDGKLHAAYNYGKGWKDTAVSQKGEVQSGSDITASQHYGVQNQTDVFYAGKDGQLSATYHNGKKWQTQEQVGDASDISKSGIAVAKNAETGGIDVFYADDEAKMQRMHVDPKNPAWKGGQMKGTASANSAVAATPHQTVKGQTDVFYRGKDGDLRAAYGNGNTWKDAALPHTADVKDSSDLAAGEQFGTPNGQTDGFYTDGDGQIHVAYHDGSGWKDNQFTK